VPHADNSPFDYSKRWGVALPIDFTAVADLDDQHDQHLVLDLVNDAVVTYADTIEVLIPSKLGDPVRTRVIRKSKNAGIYSFLEGGRKGSQFFPGRVFDENLIGHLGQSQLTTDLFIGDSLVSGIGETALCVFNLKTVFQLFQESQVFQRDEGSNGLPTAMHLHPFSLRHHAREGVRNGSVSLLSNRARHKGIIGNLKIEEKGF
jgi:hypothetical protein